MEKLGVNGNKSIKKERIGKIVEGKNYRHIKISFESSTIVQHILSNKYKLKQMEKQIYIEPEMNKEEQKELYVLRKDLKERRAKGEYCFIHENKIISKGDFLPRIQVQAGKSS